MLIWNGTLKQPKRLKSGNKKEKADKARFKGGKSGLEGLMQP